MRKCRSNSPRQIDVAVKNPLVTAGRKAGFYIVTSSDLV